MNSACYVYAILEHDVPLPLGLTGLQAAPLSLVRWGDLAAAVSPYAGMSVQPTADALLGHETVVEALCQAGPTLPCRFGTILGGQEAVIQALISRYDVLLADLKRVGNKVELGLTILFEELQGQSEALNTAQPSPTLSTCNPGPGTRYLQSRALHYKHEAAQQHQAHLVINELQRILHPHTLEQRYRTLLEPRLAIRAVYLVHQGRVRELQQAIGALRQTWPTLRWLISGPWPPYSFVSDAGMPFQQCGART
ncbi:MAG TPA: GvpL/GvpF family gas vesicle protein [Ktedonobacterales bacterium]